MTPNIAAPHEATIAAKDSFVLPDGAKVRELRQKLGWTQQDLADKIDYAKRTIEYIEKGKRTRWKTLVEVAQGLRVKANEIIAPASKGPTIELVLDQDFNSFSDEDQDRFIHSLKERLSLTGEVQVLSRLPGSRASTVVLALDLTEEEGERLFQGVMAGRLGDLNIARARRMGGSDPDTGDWIYDNRAHSLPPPLQSGSHLPEAAPAPPPLPAASPLKCSVLVVDDQPSLLSMLAQMLSPEFEVHVAESAEAAQVHFACRPIDIIMTDQMMPRITGVQLLEWVRQHHPRTTRLLMTGRPEFDDVVNAINRGHVYHYLSKPCPRDVLLGVLRDAAEKFKLERRNDQLLEELRRSNRELEQVNQRLLQRMRELEEVAQKDPFGLLNCPAIEEMAQYELKRHLRYRRPLSMGLIDLDQADLLDAERLRTGSDKVLEELAYLLTSSFRELDWVGRFHGEKFLAVAIETSEEGATQLAKRLRETVARHRFEYNGQVRPLTLSIGFAVADFAGADVKVHAEFKAMIGLAAVALAHAKMAGCNRSEVRRLPLEENG